MDEVKDHYVYCFKDKDKDGVVKYVGEGRGDRYKTKSGRTEEVKQFLASESFTIEIIKDNLTKLEAQTLEDSLIKTLPDLLNKNSTGFVKDLTFEFCSKHFYVDESSPTFLRWNIDKFTGEYSNIHSIVKHSPAGHIKPNGYVAVSLHGVSYRLHRILWVLYHKQDIPRHLVVHHRNGIRHDNSFENLELCTQQTNCRLTNREPAGMSNVVGVSIKTSVRGIQSFYATVRFKGVLYEKGFSARKYGREKALNLAIAWRNNKIEELLNTGDI